jgi:hypothetical protein
MKNVSQSENKSLTCKKKVTCIYFDQNSSIEVHEEHQNKLLWVLNNQELQLPNTCKISTKSKLSK